MPNQTKSAQAAKTLNQASASKTQAVKQNSQHLFAIRSDLRAGVGCDYRTCYKECMAKFNDDYNCQFYCDEECE